MVSESCYRRIGYERRYLHSTRSSWQLRRYGDLDAYPEQAFFNIGGAMGYVRDDGLAACLKD